MNTDNTALEKNGGGGKNRGVEKIQSWSKKNRVGIQMNIDVFIWFGLILIMGCPLFAGMGSLCG